MNAYILTGGKSKRFGSDKARYIHNQKPLIIHVKQEIQAVMDKVYAVSQVQRSYTDLGLITLYDSFNNLGPIAGLHTALNHCKNQTNDSWLMLLACDTIQLPSSSYQLLIEQIMPNTQAIAYKTDIWHPLPGMYHISALDNVEQAIHHKELALWRLLNSLKATALTPEPMWFQQRQFNTKP